MVEASGGSNMYKIVVLGEGKLNYPSTIFSSCWKIFFDNKVLQK
jgi:hypothetical protein